MSVFLTGKSLLGDCSLAAICPNMLPPPVSAFIQYSDNQYSDNQYSDKVLRWLRICVSIRTKIVLNKLHQAGEYAFRLPVFCFSKAVTGVLEHIS